jgi:dihydroneopterin aldolase / 2-amino-4-hydroxy-6-hydroxymethyldihydropteridine diphosphokinase
MFEIIIKNLKLYGYHGVNPEEKINGQEFVFNIRAKLSENTMQPGYGNNDPAFSDRISETVSYSDIIKVIKEVNGSFKFDLLESLSREVAQKIFKMSRRIEWLEVCVEKPDPPIEADLDSVGVKFIAVRDFSCKDFQDAKVFFLSIGSNIGNKEENLRVAVKKLAENKNIEILKISSIYETEPLYFKDQDSFYNIALKGFFSLRDDGLTGAAFGLLGFLKYIEYDMKRIEGPHRYGPRIIDLDIIDFDNMELKSGILTLPHPKFTERNFVLAPIAEIDPSFRINNMNIGDFIEAGKPEGSIRKIKTW